MEIKLKENSNLIIKNHNGNTLCSVDEATGEIVGGGTKLYEHHITFVDDLGYEVDAIIVSNIATQYGSGSGLPVDYVSIGGTLYKNGENYLILWFNSPEIYAYSISNNSISIVELDTPYSDYQDTVTEL